MKRSIVLLGLIFIIFFFFSCSKESTEKYVTSLNGLYLRKLPDQKSEKIDLIPFKEKLIILEKDKNIFMIEKTQGNWVKVQWNNKIGWVFDGFINTKLAVDKNLFHFYDDVNYDRKEFDLQYPNFDFQELIKSKKNVHYEKDFPANVNLFKKKPDLFYQDEIIVIKRNNINIDKIKLFYFQPDGLNGADLRFRLILTPDHFDDLYIKRIDYEKVSDKLPKIHEMKNIEDPVLLKRYLNTIIQNKDFIFTEEGYKQTQNKKEIKEAIENYYKTSLIEIDLDNKNTIHIVNFNHRSWDTYNFIAVFLNGLNLPTEFKTKDITMRAKVLSFFSIENKNYLLTYQWVAGSGEHGKIIYLLKDNTLINFANECKFCD